MKKFYKRYNKFIEFNDLQDINPNISFRKQKYSFKEDLLQMVCKNKTIIIDVGWYPEFSLKGAYTIEVIKNYNWTKPLVTKEMKDFTELEKVLRQLASIYCKV